MKQPVLKVENLTKLFPIKKTPDGAAAHFTALNNISFDVQPGEIVGILGPNGAGKTTTIQILLRRTTPTSGTVTYFGKDFFKYRSDIFGTCFICQ